MKTFIKIKLFLTILFITGCQIAPDGWHYRACNPGTSNQYYKGDYFISCNYKHFILFKDGQKINEFKTLEAAKQAAGI